MNEEFQTALKKQARTDAFRFIGVQGINLSGVSKNQDHSVLADDPFYGWALENGFAQDLNIAEKESATLFQNKIQTSFQKITVSKNATLNYILFQNEILDAQIFPRVLMEVGANANVNYFLIQKGASKDQTRVQVQIRGSHAKVQIFALQMAKKQQRLEAWLQVDHLAAASETTLECVSIVEDQAHVIFKGILDIKKQATQTKAFQKSKSLILSEHASCDALPQLWIATDAVECAHGSSISTLEPDQLVYLESRGISKSEAESMLKTAAIRSLLQKIEDTAIRGKIEAELGVLEEDHYASC